MVVIFGESDVGVSLENDLWKISWDCRTTDGKIMGGRISSIYNKRTNREYTVKSISPWLLRSLRSVKGEFFEANDKCKVGYEYDEKTRCLNMTNSENLSPEGGSVVIRYTVKAVENVNYSLWSLIEIRNDLDFPITRVRFPNVLDTDFDSVLIPAVSGGLEPRINKQKLIELLEQEQFEGYNSRYEFLQYPGRVSFQWIDYYSNVDGLLVSALDPTGRIKSVDITSQNPLDGFIPSHSSWKPEITFGLSIHEGDYTYGALHYRDWVKTTWGTYSPPKDLLGCMLKIIAVLDGGWERTTKLIRFRELPSAVLETAGMLGATKAIVHVAGWESGGHDARKGDYDAINAKLGTKRDLEHAVRKLQESGFRVRFHMNLWSLEPGGNTYTMFLREGLYSIPPRGNQRWLTIDPANPKVQEHYLLIVRRLISDYHLDGICFDQIAINPCCAIYKPEETDKTPHNDALEVWCYAYRKMMDKIDKEIKKHSPNKDSVNDTEGLPWDFITPYVFGGSGKETETYVDSFPYNSAIRGLHGDFYSQKALEEFKRALISRSLMTVPIRGEYVGSWRIHPEIPHIVTTFEETYGDGIYVMQPKPKIAFSTGSATEFHFYKKEGEEVYVLGILNGEARPIRISLIPDIQKGTYEVKEMLTSNLLKFDGQMPLEANLGPSQVSLYKLWKA